jgi:methyl-accepting chemotaxis protein
MFSNLKIRGKLLIPFFVITGLTILLGTFSLLQISRVNDTTEDIAGNTLPTVTLLGTIDSQLNLNRRGEIQVCTKTTPEEYGRYVKRLTETAEKITTSLATLDKLPLTADEKKSVEGIKTRTAAYYKDAATTFEIAKTGNVEETITAMRTVSKKSYDAAQKGVNEMIDTQQKEAAEVAAHAKRVYTSATYWVLAIVIACAAISISLGILIAGLIAGPMHRLATEVDKVAGGDLRVQLTHQGNDEIGQLTASFAAMITNLRSMIGKIEDASRRVSSTAGQVYGTAEKMVNGAEKVASQAGTVATAGEEMAATSGDIAQNCSMAAEAAKQANQKAEAGVAVVEGTVDIMNQIAERVMNTSKTVEGLGARSDQIGNIISVIEDIADQTNLLALNAAIEAARAGEQGRGFAVVADEVRALAERTTRATREIGEMIKSIQQETKSAVAAMEEGVHKVEQGHTESARSGEAIQSILQQINEVAMQVNQIATAAEEQTATTSEISSNMIQITDVIQQTAQGAQESATAASQLNLVAEELHRLVGQFKLA